MAVALLLTACSGTSSPSTDATAHGRVPATVTPWTRTGTDPNVEGWWPSSFKDSTGAVWKFSALDSADPSAPAWQSRMATYDRPDPHAEDIDVWYNAGSFKYPITEVMQQQSKGTFTQTPEGVGCERATDTRSNADVDFCAVDIVARSTYLVTGQKTADIFSAKDSVPPELTAFLIALRACISTGSNSG